MKNDFRIGRKRRRANSRSCLSAQQRLPSHAARPGQHSGKWGQRPKHPDESVEYSEPQRRLLKEQFRPIAERFRSARDRLGWYFVAGLLSGILVGSLAEHLFPTLPSPWILVVSTVGLAYGLPLWMASRHPPPECPGCSMPLLGILSSHCPSCGAAGLPPDDEPIPPVCRACGVRLWSGKSRRYRVHACTWCGLRLDDIGL